MAEYTPGPWEWVSRDKLGCANTAEIVLEFREDPEGWLAGWIRCSDANRRLIAAAPETKAQLDEALKMLNQALPFVIAWAHNHRGPDGKHASALGMRVAARMQAAIAKAQP